MIKVTLQKNGTIKISPLKKYPEARKWMQDLFVDPYFSSAESDKTIFPPPTNDEEINEEWGEYAVPEMLEACSSLREKFETQNGHLLFDQSSISDLAALLNQARLKIATAGTSDVLPPSPNDPRLSQYEFLTALLELTLQIEKLTRDGSE